MWTMTTTETTWGPPTTASTTVWTGDTQGPPGPPGPPGPRGPPGPPR
jgi:hypothetical protein